MTQRRVHRLREGHRLAAYALRSGAVREGLTGVRWDISGKCLNPRAVEHESRPDAQERSRGSPSMHVVLETRCRRCRECLRARSRTWTYRAKAELAGAWRTWFGTITLSAERQYYVFAAARRECRRKGVEWDTLTEEDQFLERHSVISKELTKWLKRVRKESGAKLRYILVAEAHKTGLPHYHVLVHELSSDIRVGERTLRTQWHWGFTKFNLVTDPRAAIYVCKYLTKSVLARVRASLRYGTNDLSSQPAPGARRENPAPPNPISAMQDQDYGDCPYVVPHKSIS